MANISSLGTEILIEIFQYVDDESPRTTKRSLLLVNKHFYAATQLVAHRRKTICYTDNTLKETNKRIQTWLQDPLLLRNVRHLTLTGYMYRPDRLSGDPIPSSSDLTSMWVPLVELVTKAARLTKVSFDIATVKFPLPLLQALQTYHAQVKLYIWGYHREEELDHTDPAEQALAISPILRGIKGSAWVDQRSPKIDLRTAAFQRIVANAPNLELASFSKGRTGCMPPSKDQVRKREAAAKFFLDSRGPNTSIRKLVLDGFDISKQTLVKWGTHVSLPHLEDLKISRGTPDRTYFEAAPALLTNLKHLSLNLSGVITHSEIPRLLEGYLATCAPLETLSLWSWMGVVSIDAILKHGTTLKKLELHEREASIFNDRRRLLSVEDVRRIGKGCPHLEDLTLDLDREDADWRKDLDYQKDILEELAQLGKRLRRIQIYLDLGIAMASRGRALAAVQAQSSQITMPGAGIHDSERTTDHTALCLLSAAAANVATEPVSRDYRGPFKPPSTAEMCKHGQQLWKTIFGKPTQFGPRELDIKWGEWERKQGSGHLASWVFWEQRRKRYLRVRPAGRDDRPGEAIVHVEGGCRQQDDDDDKADNYPY
ncbi:hypothetical protein GJ744_007226 [Endocarpon pusillum]|uniref:F-box domain-containing protein n=1 Tax=Endocarpon pusillum TaxID=364733 RepID=A0A8H7AKZ3_9EURO|nr:hypothetical protein GJ744_007226 [Endocarpon pusillum]